MFYKKTILQELCNVGISIARRAGDKILYHYNNFDSVKDVRIKADLSPVTIADLASHHEIVQGLKHIELKDTVFNLPILSEEDSEINHLVRLNWDDYWLVDPLDGTKEFINRNGEFCINIALIHNNKPIIGIIYAPYFDVLYYALLNQGAYKIDKQSSPQRIYTNSLIKPELTELNIATSRRHNKTSKYNDFIKKLKKNNIKCNSLFSGSAIKFGLVAEGKADLYPRFGLTYEWDTAAGDCILREAGGKLAKINGEGLYYNKREILINPEFYAAGDKNFDWQQYF
jgi:3'(2'), 5'-bisphosphate nucleotidase